MTYKIEYKKLDELIPFNRNPKQHPSKQIDRLVKSLEEYGWTNPILAIKHNGKNMVLAGHARIQAAEKAGIKEVPVIFLDLPYEKAIAYNIADNKLAELADWDDGVLQDLLTELQEYEVDLESIGFDESELEDLLGDNYYEEKDLDEDLIDDEELMTKFKLTVPSRIVDDIEGELKNIVENYENCELERME